MPRILLVDDDPDILTILAAAFESAGHQVCATPNPIAVEPLTRQQRFDAVVLDVMMPDRSGWEVLESLRSDPRTERLPVLMLSAIGDATNRVRGIRKGADDFLPKPFHPEEIIARIEGLVERRASEVPGLQGDLAVVPVSDVLQSLMNSMASGVLELATPAGEGSLGFVHGRCLEAAFDGLGDVEAVVALLPQRAGTFRLRLDSWDEDEPGRTPLPLSRLMLEAVWIEDELRVRLSLLPADGCGLYAVALEPAPASPPGLPELPVDLVLDVLRERPGILLADLLSMRLAAPQRVRLAVAWLIEDGRVSWEHLEAMPVSLAPEPPAAPEETEEELLLEELAGEGRLRGFAPGPVEVAVLVQPGAWPTFVPLLASLPAPPRGPAPAGLVSVQCGRRELLLHVDTLASSPLPDGPSLPPCVAVILWLGEDLPDEAAEAASAVERQAAPRAYLLAVSPTGRSPLPGSRLRVIQRIPRDLADLLDAILAGE
jgi:CheY-like chemotaxis protein